MTALSLCTSFWTGTLGGPITSTIVLNILRQCSRREILRDTKKFLDILVQPDGRCSQGCKRDIRSVILSPKTVVPQFQLEDRREDRSHRMQLLASMFSQNGARPLAAQHSPSRGPGASCSPPRFLNLVRHTHFVSSYTMHININVAALLKAIELVVPYHATGIQVNTSWLARRSVPVCGKADNLPVFFKLL